MIYPALLFSITGYSWYLVFTCNTGPGNLPVTGGGLAGLLFVAVLPAILGFYTSRKILAHRPSVAAIILKTAKNWLLFFLVTALPEVMGNKFMTGSFVQTNGVLYILPAIGQLLGWSSGVYHGANRLKPVFKEDPSAVIKESELNIIIFLPAFFLLGRMGYSASLLVVLLICWFIVFALALSLGDGEKRGPAFYPGILLVHTVVPVIITAFLFGLLFTVNFLQLLSNAKKVLCLLIWYVMNWLNDSLGKTSDTLVDSPDAPGLLIGSGHGAAAGGPLPLVILLFFIILATLVLALGIYSLLKYFKTKLDPPASGPVENTGHPRLFRHVFQGLVVLARHIWDRMLFRVRCFFTGLGAGTNNPLSPNFKTNTPCQQVIQCYGRFLKWGKRRGHPIKPGETPLEYALRLQGSITQHPPLPLTEINQLTGLFIEARYSGKPINGKQSAACKRLLKMITRFPMVIGNLNTDKGN